MSQELLQTSNGSKLDSYGYQAFFAKNCKATFNFMVSEASPRQEDLEELIFYSYQMVQNWTLVVFSHFHKNNMSASNFVIKR